MNQFKKAKDVLTGIKMAEEFKERFDTRKCDWEDPLDVAVYRSIKAQEDRRRIIQGITADMSCPECEEKVYMLSQWVLSRDQKNTICRSCHSRLLNNPIPKKPIVHTISIFTKEIRFEIDAMLFAAARAGVASQREFSRLAGWTRAYQRRLEGGEVKTVNEETMKTIISVFTKFNVSFPEIK